MRIFLLSILLFPLSKVSAMGFDCNDPDVVFCMDLVDGSGTVARERSRNGLTGTLNGGPAWVIAETARPEWNSSLSGTNTYVSMPPHYLNFTRTAGEDVTTGNTTVGDFSGNKPGMIAFVWKKFGNNPSGRSNEGVFGWGTSAGGWIINDNAGGGWANTLSFLVQGVLNLYFDCASPGCPFTDLMPHAYGVWWDGSGNFQLFRDGKLTSSKSAVGDFVTVANTGFSVQKDQNGGTEAGGGMCCLRVWNKAVARNQAQGFFQEYTASFLGGIAEGNSN